MNTRQKKALYESIMKTVAKLVKKALNENTVKPVHRRRNLNESMLMPNEASRVWWDGKDSLFIEGTNGMYYNCYPTYGDAYEAQSPTMEKLDEIRTEVYKLVFADNKPRHITIHAWRDNYDMFGDDLKVGIMCYGWDLTPEIKQKIQNFLSKKGFGQYIEAAEWSQDDEILYPYLDVPEDEFTEEWVELETANMEDVTDKVAYLFSGNYRPKQASLQALNILKDDDPDGYGSLG